MFQTMFSSPLGVPRGRMTFMTDPKPVESWLTDMDGVLVHEELALPGAS